MEQCSKLDCTSRLRQTDRGANNNNVEQLVSTTSSSDTVTEASKYRALSPSRPQCRKAVDNLMPEGNLLVSTELSSNFLPVVARRPSSAREDFRRRRDNLKTEGNVSYQVEGKSSYSGHHTVRPKIYKPRPCGDCSAPVISASKVSARRNEEIVSREEKVIRPAEKPVVRVEIKEPAERGSKKTERKTEAVQREEREEREPLSDWPSWSSEPRTLGDHVRSVFLDLCSGQTVGELQQTFPHHWGLLLARLSSRPDLRLELLDRVNRRD